jgi:hypothetical protein
VYQLLSDYDTSLLLVVDPQPSTLNPNPQPASITKVVTSLVILQLRDKSKDRQRFMRVKVPVSKYASSFAFWNSEHGWNSGTNAKLRAGEMYTVRELLYALMLPSGNDAAIALAEFFGPCLPPAPTSKPPPSSPSPNASPDAAPQVWPHDRISRFVAEMNRCVFRCDQYPAPSHMTDALTMRVPCASIARTLACTPRRPMQTCCRVKPLR